MGKTEMAELERLLEAATATTIRGQHWDAYSHAARQAVPSLIAAVRERDAVIAAVRELAEHWAEVAEELGWARGAHFQDCADEVRANLPPLRGIEQEEGKA